MDQSWLELTGRYSLLVFAAFVAALLFAAVRRIVSRSPGRLDRFLLEYLGNVPLADLQGAGAIAIPEERRENGETRALLDEIVREMDRRRVPAFKRAVFLDELRGAIRAEEQLYAAGLEGREAERRFLEAQRWALAERFHAIVDDPPAEIVARIKSGPKPDPGVACSGVDAER